LRADALLIFAGVGLVFPALVTLLTFRSNALLGPTVTSAVSGTAPLFALLAAAVLLGERVPARTAVAAVGVVAGIALLSWKPGATPAHLARRLLLWPIAGALVRGLAQVGAKAGLLLWPNPFAASLIGYLVSSIVVVSVDRAARAQRPRPTRQGIIWFAATGLLNGGAVLLMYAALASAPVGLVAPIVASHPLVTLLVSALVLREERLSPRGVAGAVITVGAIAWLVAPGYDNRS
jgi:drug/metabolite transporter (DMT)-like permease